MKKVNNILILAGGASRRFWPLGDKQLVNFLGLPLIYHQVAFFSRFAAKVVVVANQNNFSSIKKVVRNFAFPVKVVVQTKDFPGMAGAVFSARHFLKGPVLVVNGDDLFGESLFVDLLKKLNKKTEGLIVAKKVDRYFPGGYLKFDENHRLIAIIEKPLPTKTPSSLVRVSVDYFKEIDLLVKFFGKVKTSGDDLYEKSLSELIKVNRVDYLITNSDWQPIKYPWQVILAMSYFFSNKLAKMVDKSPPVFFGENVRLGKFTKIVGPTYIGDNTTIGDFVLIRGSNIEANCLIGAHSEVARSYLGQGVMIHRNYVGDSVFAANVLMGAGAITANFRFDAQTVKSNVDTQRIDSRLNKLGTIVGCNSKLGVNSVLFPGVKIGRNSFIAPGETVRKDVSDGRFFVKNKTVNNKLYEI